MLGHDGGELVDGRTQVVVHDHVVGDGAPDGLLLDGLAQPALHDVLGIATAFVGLCYLSSVSFIPVAVAVVVFYTFPIVIVLLNPLVEGEPLTLPLIGIVILALAGVALVVGPAFEGLDWRGIALALGASIATATQFFAAARATRTSVIAKTFWVHVLVLPTAALIGLATGSLAPPATLALAPLAVAVTVVG